ncbi:MAG: glycosyltransferase [Beduini sp.]
MKKSLVIAVYNGEKYLIEQLNSVLNQTEKLDEVILIDDLSTDQSFNIIKKFIEQNNLSTWKLIKNEKNLGYKGNFRKGLELVSGDVIFLSDQDDIWHEGKVEKICYFMNDNPNILSLGTSFNLIDEHTNKFEIPLKKGYANQNLINFPIKEDELIKIDIKFLHQRNFCQGCTMAFKKEIKDEFLKVSTQKNPHDWEINLIACSHGGSYFYNHPLIDYRIHGDNTIGLEEQISGLGEDYQSKRVNERIDFLNDELPLILFALNLEGFSLKEKKFLANKYDYVKERIQLIQKHKWYKILINYCLGKYFGKGTFRTMLGDMISSVKK